MLNKFISISNEKKCIKSTKKNALSQEFFNNKFSFNINLNTTTTSVKLYF